LKVLVKLANWRDTLKSHPMVRAFAISIGLHIVAFFVIEGGHAAGLWEQRAVPKWAMKQSAKVDPNAPKNANEPVVLQFIEVEQATEEPQDARLYSAAPTTAANPDTRQDLNKPKIDGTQDKVPKIRDVVKAEPVPPPQPQPKATLQPNTKQSQQAAAEPPGDTKQNTLTPDEKAARDLTFDRPAQKQTRPKTLAEARQRAGIEGPRMKQDGGVKKYSIETDADVKSSPFGSYDAMFIQAVQVRWFELLEKHSINHSGKVVVDFRLHKDGRITSMKIAENTVTDTLSWCCQRAIMDPAPYAPFPPDLKRLLAADYREVRFTFHFN
jgi:hypothetical protein